MEKTIGLCYLLEQIQAEICDPETLKISRVYFFYQVFFH